MPERQSRGALTATLDALKSLATRLGEWPLMLELAAETINKRRRRGNRLRWQHVNEALDQQGVTALDVRDAKQRSDAVSTATMDISLRYWRRKNKPPVVS